MPDEILNNEAKVIAEESKRVEPTETNSKVPETITNTQKKKKNPVVVILLVLVGLAVLCCSCTVGGIFILNRYLQNTPQSLAVKELYTALSENDKQKVASLTSERLYSDLYKPFNNGSTLADLLKDNVESVSISSVEVQNDSATVSYEIKVKKNAEIFDKVTYAELTKIAPILEEPANWQVTYLGPAPKEK